MKELYDFIWNMPMIYAAIGLGLLLAPLVWVLIWALKGLYRTSKRMDEMDKDFDEMRKRVRSRLDL